MLKVPRSWTQQMIKWARTPAHRQGHAVIYIGSDIVTLGFHVPNVPRSNVKIRNKQAKKRLGSRSITPSLTQSLTLSHINRILAQLNSSSPITIILPAARFTRISVSVPAGLAPQDVGPTLGWALEQQGFAPLNDWLWDAIATRQSDAHAATYDVLLIETALVEGFVQRLGVANKRLRRLVADSSIASAIPAETLGPWLHDSQIQQVLAVLEHEHARNQQSPPKQADGGALLEPFNLAYNLVARNNARYTEAFVHSAIIASALVLIGVSWGWPARHTPSQEDTTAEMAPLPTPVHPLFTHGHVWQQLHALNANNVQVKRLEFRRNSWLLQIQAQNPGLADTWISQLGEKLNAQPIDTVTGRSTSPWRVLTTASRSENGLTQIELELQY